MHGGTAFAIESSQVQCKYECTQSVERVNSQHAALLTEIAALFNPVGNVGQFDFQSENVCFFYLQKGYVCT